MSRSSTEEAQVVVEMVLMFLRHQFTAFSELQRKVGMGFLLFRSNALAQGGTGVVVVLLGL